jgi:hypothetical protein
VTPLTVRGCDKAAATPCRTFGHSRDHCSRSAASSSPGNKNGNAGEQGDGSPATLALLTSPAGIATDPASDIFVTDSGYSQSRPTAHPAPAGTALGVLSAALERDGQQLSATQTWQRPDGSVRRAGCSPG